jgi:hypothetical protein
MDTTTQPIIDPALVDFLIKAKKLREQQRNASRKYYTNKFKITDNMTDSQKQEITDNIARRKEAYKAKYEANKELYKQRAKEYREYRKSLREVELDMEQVETTEQTTEL